MGHIKVKVESFTPSDRQQERPVGRYHKLDDWNEDAALKQSQKLERSVSLEKSTQCHKPTEFVPFTQGHHLSGKLGNVGEFDSCQRNIRDFTKCQESVKEKNLVMEKWPKTVYCKLRICVCSCLCRICTFYFVFGSCTVAFLPPPLTITLVLA